MLREITPVRQDSSTVTRRWFQDDYFDLFVWIDIENRPTRFQLCYDRQHEERALVWDGANGFLHQRVDSGETTPMRNDAPMFVSDEKFQAALVIDQFDRRAVSIPDALRREISDKLLQAADRLRVVAD